MNEASRRSPAIARLLSSKPPCLGPFRLITQIGAGGFAPVFSAVEEHAGIELRTVALKLFATAEIVNPMAVLDEARALCRVEHPNVVRFMQLVMEDGVVGIAMEHVRGVSVESRIDGDGPLPLEAALEMGVAVARALACVHANGIVHRDVKPANVIDANGTYKLIDFGIARVKAPGPPATSIPPTSTASVRVGRDRTGDSAVVTGATIDERSAGTRGTDATDHDGVAGTIGYIDPACLSEGVPADPSSDLYALGAMLYECLSGRLPASNDADVSQIHLPIALGVDPPRPLASIAPAISVEVARLVDSLVAPRRANRPRRAEWVASELERLLRASRGDRRALPEEGPFRGLAQFTGDDRDVYFGRTADLASAIEILRGRGVVSLVGPSGSGKSSLARAALLPAVIDGALGAWPPRWNAISFSPGFDAMAAFRSALNPMIEEPLPDSPEELAEFLTARVDATATGLIVLVDALEEAVTFGGESGAGAFARFVGALAASPRSGLRVVLTVRRDFLDPLLVFTPWASALTRGAVLVAPLGASALGEVLVERLSLYGYALEDASMRAEIAEQLASAAESMPLVEFALTRLWEERDEERRVIPRAALGRIGGIGGALQRHAEDIIAKLEREHGQAILPVVHALLLALTTARGTRVRRTRDELLREIEDRRAPAVLDAFESARIVVLDDRRFTLAHEALLREWPRLRAWIDATAKARAVVEEVEESAKKWREGGGNDRLLRGAPLAAARSVARGSTLRLSESARRFVEASRRFEMRGTAGVIGLIVALAAGGLVLGALYFRAARETEVERRRAHELANSLLSGRDATEEQRAGDIAKLIVEKKACEKELDRARATIAP